MEDLRQSIQILKKHWLHTRLRSQNFRVTTMAIQRKTLELSCSSTPGEPGSSNKPFAASGGWFYNFMKLWGFSLQRIYDVILVC